MLQLEWARGPSTTARTDFGLRAAARRDLGSCCLGICTFGMLPLGKIPLGSCHLKRREGRDGVATILTIPTTIIFYRDPTPTLKAESEWQLPSLPQLPSVFREAPPPPLKLNLNGNYPYYPNYHLFLVRPHP